MEIRYIIMNRLVPFINDSSLLTTECFINKVLILLNVERKQITYRQVEVPRSLYSSPGYNNISQ